MIATTSTNESNLLEKVKEIEEILSARDCDLWRLREAALTDGGLVNGKRTAPIIDYIDV